MGFERMLQHGTLIAVAVLILCVFGISSALRVPVQMIPDLETRTISVDTRWPGASPRDVEQEILIEQEEYLRTLPGLRRMVSTSSVGQANIELEFPFGVDINEALIRTNNALSQVSGYPENVDAPSLSTISSSDDPFMYFRVGPRTEGDANLDLKMMRSFLEDQVRPRLERINGVSLVDIRGTEERQVRIEVDPYRLAERGLDMADLRNALRLRNIDHPAGDLDSGKRNILVRTVGRFSEPADIGELIVAEREGSLVRLSDVAEIQLSHHELRTSSYYNGLPALILAVRRETGSNVVQTKYAVLPAVEAINTDILSPLGLEMTLVNEDARYVEDSISNVWNNLLLGTLLATLAMYAFLRSMRSTIVGVIGIPICTVAAFIGLLLAGRTLNVISMAGVAFAIGMTLDNTIVVLESIDQARKRGLTPFQAAVEGVRRVWPAILACTLTTVLVFAPTLFIRQEAGQLYSDIAIAISAAILASMAVAVTVLPALASRLLPKLTSNEPTESSALGRIGNWITASYHSPQRRVIILLATLFAAVCTTVWLTPPAEYLPEGEEARIFSRMIAPPGYNLAEVESIAQILIPELQQRLEDDPALFHRGETDIPALRFFSMFVDAQGISVITDPKNAGDLEALMKALETRFTAWPGMRAFASRGSIISSNDGGTRSINLNISGTDLAQIYQVAGRAYARAGSLFEGAQIGSEPSSLSLNQSLLEVHPRWERLAEVGLSAERFGYSVAALSDGAFADDMILNDRRVDIYLFSNAGSEQKAEHLRDLPIATPAGLVLPLSALAELRESIDTDSIRRVDGRRTVTLNIVPPRSVALETGVDQVRTDLIDAMRLDGEIPYDISVSISGASDQLQATREAVSSNFLLAVLLCYLMLVAIFRHWGRPLFVMATIPLGIIGGIIGLAILNGVGATFGIHQPFDMITLLGFLVLLGAVVNNPILIVQEAYQRMEEGAESITSAVDDAINIRLRAILMSSLTTILGIAPLVFIPGAGTELYRGLGAIVMFGVAFSTLVTLTVLPSLMITLIALQQSLVSRLRVLLTRPQTKE